MKAVAALSLVAMAAALPAPELTKKATEPTRFNGVAIDSGSDIQYASVNANGLQFWLDKDTSTYCPDVDGVECPSGDISTIFARAEGSNSLSLSTTVPGGQQVYVASDGLLKFTQAHSGNTGEGSFITGFSVADGALQFDGYDFLACPADGAYQVFAASKVSDAATTDCLGFLFRTEETNGTAAWQYS